MGMDTDRRDEQEGTTKEQEGGDEDRRRQNNDADVDMDDATPTKAKGEEMPVGADKREGNGTSAVPATGAAGGDEDDAVEY